MSKQKTLKRKLSDISFDHTGAHIALVGPSVGGPANERTTLIMKANANFTEEVLEKAQKIQVTLELPEFLEKFFRLYGEDAAVLAALLGYDESKKETKTSYWSDPEKYIEDRVKSFEILKKLYITESFTDALSSLKGDDYLQLLEDQVSLEPLIKQAETQTETSVEKSKAPDYKVKDWVKFKGLSGILEGQIVSLEKSAVTLRNKDKFYKTDKGNLLGFLTISKGMKMENTEGTTELVEKSALEVVQKALDEQKVALEKALKQVADFEAEKKAAIQKARKDNLEGIVKVAEQVEVLFKALGEVDNDTFEKTLKVLKSLSTVSENSEMFIEKGVGTTGKETTTENPLAARLKAKYKKS